MNTKMTLFLNANAVITGVGRFWRRQVFNIGGGVRWVMVVRNFGIDMVIGGAIWEWGGGGGGRRLTPVGLHSPTPIVIKQLQT